MQNTKQDALNEELAGESVGSQSVVLGQVTRGMTIARPTCRCPRRKQQVSLSVTTTQKRPRVCQSQGRCAAVILNGWLSR